MAAKKAKKTTKPAKAKKAAKAVKYVYSFGGGKADGRADMKNLLGGKGANLAEMGKIGLPVPPGFTLTTEVCTAYYANNRKYPAEVKPQVEAAMVKVEKVMGLAFGSPDKPLLVSVRSGARQSMPGMMETVLNVGLTTKTIPGLVAMTGGNERFVWDAYRRLIMMYSDVVMEKAAGVEPAEGMGIRMQLEHLMELKKEQRGITQDTQMSVEDLKDLCAQFRAKVKQVLGKEFPDDATEQLWGGIGAVFQSWMGRRAVAYRRIEGIPQEWGTATNVQAMVFGNMGDDSATGVAFTRNPATGDRNFYGEWLVNAQGEDVVAGIRTPSPLNKANKTEHTRDLLSLEEAMPATYRQLVQVRNQLEKHYRDMQDIEFTIQQGKLYMLQTRTGKRTGLAAVHVAVDMVKEKLIDSKTALLRVSSAQLDELLHPSLDPAAEQKVSALTKGLPAGPGGATGQIVLTADKAEQLGKTGQKVILVRNETSPEDVHGMYAAAGILTAKGGMTSHAALVARGWGKCCIVGCGALKINTAAGTVTAGGKTLKEGDWISLNGSRGLVYEGQLALKAADPDSDPAYKQLMKWADATRRLGVWANADTPEDARRALGFGAEGIGLLRTEHMFYGKGAEEPLFRLRKMIHSDSVDERRKALDELFPYVKSDMKGVLESMNGKPVTIRLLDPPLHEFVPQGAEERQKLATSLGISLDDLAKRAEGLHETNPMMGHRGVRLGITYPEVSEMQIRAILEAAAELLKAGKKPMPEIMIPVTCDVNELKNQEAIVNRVAAEVKAKYGAKKLPFHFGTMIEIPRAALLADEMAESAQFFSFGTNDLTQMSYGFSRDDIGGFVPDYIAGKILPGDPFQSLDQKGVGQLMKMSVTAGRKTRPDLKVGICGEHGGDPRSVAFCHRIGLNYVSCSPFRVPVARLAAAQAVVGKLPEEK
ncbi:MAG: Pyruvate, phosphate dikinase [Phycisphaerae bacterium]|nr:Pyruvate, phosphate dikinase [Phycisphaerae bacterium]